MSSIAITGGATGTGVFSLLAPSTSTNRTINLPDSNGTILTTATAGVPVNGPAFSAYLASNQSISNATNTKVLYDTEDFDTASCFASSRFTPTVAGYYQINAGFQFAGTSGINQLQIYKNGSQYKIVQQVSSASTPETQITHLIYLNGSTDYVEIYIFQNSGGAANISGQQNTTWFQAFLARSAT